MKRFVSVLFAILITVGLCGCQQSDDSVLKQSEPVQSETMELTQASEEPTESSTQASEAPTEPSTHSMESVPPATTEPGHSSLYLPDVTTEEMIKYFREVVLDMEYTAGDGDATLVQKWMTPIYYMISGEPTDADRELLNSLFGQLNEIEGFPGIFPTEDENQKNLSISFLDANTFRLAFSDFLRGEEADGAVQFWYYTASNDIYTGRIGYRTDISQEIRNSVILEEVINLLGFNDTVLREDSIVYQYSSDATQLSETDWVLLKLLYHPDIRCGMNYEECQAVLEQLYY